MVDIVNFGNSLSSESRNDKRRACAQVGSLDRSALETLNALDNSDSARTRCFPDP